MFPFEVGPILKWTFVRHLTRTRWDYRNLFLPQLKVALLKNAAALGFPFCLVRAEGIDCFCVLSIVGIRNEFPTSRDTC